MAAPYPQVVLFGDSLFEGCVDIQDGFSFYATLQKHCLRRYDVVNRGFSGYNTSQALNIFEQLFPAPGPGTAKMEYLVILLGANDAALPLDDNNQYVSLEGYKRNLVRMVGHPHVAAHGCKVPVVTPPPLDEIRRTEVDVAQHGRATREQARIAAYSQAAREVAAGLGERSVACVDLAKALMDHAVANTPCWDASQPPLGSAAGGRRGYLEKLLPDGLHMSGEAYKVLWGLLEPEIEPRFPNEDTEGYAWPVWRDAPWLESVLEKNSTKQG
ncbi:SGNH hydrolase-type esterase domain-containing protein [Diaporthe sp. PMI_573]|nr:SGNH hydrolase-type esterase domain-containing protein [Diaporthaceae sp. PMI_573]